MKLNSNHFVLYFVFFFLVFSPFILAEYNRQKPRPSNKPSGSGYKKGQNPSAGSTFSKPSAPDGSSSRKQSSSQYENQLREEKIQALTRKLLEFIDATKDNPWTAPILEGIYQFLGKSQDSSLNSKEFIESHHFKEYLNPLINFLTRVQESQWSGGINYLKESLLDQINELLYSLSDSPSTNPKKSSNSNSQRKRETPASQSYGHYKENL